MGIEALLDFLDVLLFAQEMLQSLLVRIEDDRSMRSINNGRERIFHIIENIRHSCHSGNLECPGEDCHMGSPTTGGGYQAHHFGSIHHDQVAQPQFFCNQNGRLFQLL